MEANEYRFLRVSARIFDVLSWFFLALYVAVAFIGFFGGGGPDTPRAGSFLWVFVGGLVFLIFKSLGAIIQLLLDIESRTKP